MKIRPMSLDNFIDVKKPITEISSRKVVSASEKSKLIDIINLMFSQKLRKIPIIDESGNLKGIVSSTDLLDLFGGGEKYEIFNKNRGSLEMKVENFMARHVKTIHYRTNIRKSLEIFRSERSGLYPVVDSKKVISVVSEWDFVKLINAPVGIKVYDVMVERPFFVRRGYNIYDVSKMMCRGGSRRLPVVEDNILIGMVTPADIIMHIHKNRTYNKLFLDKTRVESIMSKDMITIKPDSDLFLAANLMKNMRVGGLPVVDEEEVIGIITERDIVDALI
jgi:CBS domain-containing protein